MNTVCQYLNLNDFTFVKYLQGLNQTNFICIFLLQMAYFARLFLLKVGVFNSWLDQINWRKKTCAGPALRALSRKPLWLGLSSSSSPMTLQARVLVNLFSMVRTHYHLYFYEAIDTSLQFMPLWRYEDSVFSSNLYFFLFIKWIYYGYLWWIGDVN